MIKSRFLFLLVTICLTTSIESAFSQSPLFKHRHYVSDNGDTLKYRQLISDSDPVTKYPLVIFLHGSGERGNDNEAQLQWGVLNFASSRIMKTYRPIVIAPQCPKNLKWGNYSQGSNLMQSPPTKPMELLIELIDKVKKTMPVDPDRIYITGLSMGGMGTYDAIARHPDLFAAAVPVCGRADASQASKIAHIPLWIFHGVLDQSVPSEQSRNMVEALTNAGANPGYTQYPESGHFSWIAAYSDQMMMDWLFRQHK